MRRLAPLAVLLVLALASTATAAVTGRLVVGTAKPERLVGTAGPDRVQAAFGGADRVDCGRGADLVSADQVDRILGCETVVRRISVDPYRNPDAQHETAVEPDSFAFGGTVVAAYQLGRRRGGAAANVGTAVSRDGGRTWRRSLLPGLTGNQGGSDTAASDPVVAYDAAHGVWLVATLTIGQNSSRILVSRSTDGLRWSAPIEVAAGPVLDKEWIVCDNGAASPFAGRCYTAYTDDVKNVVVNQYSDDGGVTWSPPVRASSILVGTQPVVQPNGTLVVVAGEYRGDHALSGAMVALRSTDGGATFLRFTVADLQSVENAPMRAISLPSVDVDAGGTIYAVWHDCRFRSGCTRNDVVLSTSADGQTWTPPARVPTLAATAGTFVPAIAADPARPGRLGLVYAYFHPAAPRRVGVGFTQTRDGGRTWSSQRLDAQAFDPSWLPLASGGRMLGDYLSVSFANGRAIPVFALAASPLAGRFRQAVFAASLP